MRCRMIKFGSNLFHTKFKHPLYLNPYGLHFVKSFLREHLEAERNIPEKFHVL